MPVQARFDIVAQDKTKQAFQSVKQGLSGIKQAFSGMKTAILSAIGVTGLGALVKTSLDAGDRVQKLAIKLGATTEALSQYRHVAELAGVDFEALADSFEKLQRNVALAAAGTGPAKLFLKNLGIDAKAFAALRPEAQFEQLADKLMAIKNPGERAAYVMGIMGRQGAMMLPVMEGGAAAITALREEADAMGLTLTRSMVDSMANANDQLARMKHAVSSVGIVLASQLAPLIIRASEAFLRASQSVREHADTLVDIGKLLGAGSILYLGFRQLPSLLGAAGSAFTLASRAVATFMAAFAVSPIAALTTSLSGVSAAALWAGSALGKLKVAAGTLFSAFLGWHIGSWLRENFMQARVAGLSFVGSLLKGWENVKYSAQVAWLSMASGWEKAVAMMKEAFSGFLDYVGSGLSGLPLVDSAGSALQDYAKALKRSADTNSQSSMQLFALSQQHEKAKAAIDSTITALVAYEMGIGQTNEATRQTSQSMQTAAVALGELSDKTNKVKKAKEKLNPLLKEAQQLTQSLRTPLEVYQDNLAKINLLLQQGYITQETYNRGLAQYQQTLADDTGVTEALEKQQQAYENHVQQVQGIFQNALFAFMDEGFEGMVKSFQNALTAMAADAAAAEIGKLLFGASAQGGSGLLSQFLGDGFGKLFGFGSFGGFRAQGGSVSVGKQYVVGEKEPELFTPSVSGQITPLSQLASNASSTIVINNYIQTPNVESFQRAEGNLTARMKLQLDRAGRRNL